MEPNARYLLRIDRRQVPVIYDGWGLWHGEGGEEGVHRHAFTRIDTGEWVFRRSARAVSKHYDQCVTEDRGSCNCRAKLEALRKPETQLPEEKK